MNAVHRALVRITGGRVGYQAIGMPVLELVTIGRRSGASRAVMLTSPCRDGEAYVVVASRGGDDRHPAWFLNLEANPEVEVQLGRDRQKAQAKVVAPSDPDYNRLWKIVNENNSDRYTAYQEKTDRPIPVVVLTST